MEDRVAEPTLLAIQNQGLYAGQRKVEAGSGAPAQSLSSKWKAVLFSEGSLFDMQDPWAEKKELKLEGLSPASPGKNGETASGAAGDVDSVRVKTMEDESGFEAVWSAKTQAKLAVACKHTFERWDLNKDGTLDMDEFNLCMTELCLRLTMPKVCSWCTLGIG